MFSLLRPALFALPPETAHELTLGLLAHIPLPAAAAPPPSLAVEIAGLHFPSPIGLAAGFDKDARAWEPMLRLGFGFVEIGTLTPLPQAGNPQPRIFRLPEDAAVINRLGFNNGGLAAALPRLRVNPRMGVNVGANKDSADRIADYATGVRAVREVAAWITLNISSPNTPGLRGLQDSGLNELLAAAAQACGRAGPPLFLKVAPDLDSAQIEAISDTVLNSSIAALIVGNTTIARPPGLHSVHSGEAGGLSGAPLMAPSTARLRAFARQLKGRVPLVGVGGISSAEDVYAKLRAGASVVQLYTALVYAGPGLPARLNADLARLLERDGLTCVADAVGLDLEQP